MLDSIDEICEFVADQFPARQDYAKAAEALLTHLRKGQACYVTLGAVRLFAEGLKEFGPRDALTLMQHLSTAKMHLFEQEFELHRDDIQPDLEPIVVEPEVVEEAFAQGYLVDPELNIPYRDFKSRLVLRFRGTSDLDRVLEP